MIGQSSGPSSPGRAIVRSARLANIFCKNFSFSKISNSKSGDCWQRHLQFRFRYDSSPSRDAISPGRLSTVSAWRNRPGGIGLTVSKRWYRSDDMMASPWYHHPHHLTVSTLCRMVSAQRKWVRIDLSIADLKPSDTFWRWISAQFASRLVSPFACEWSNRLVSLINCDRQLARQVVSRDRLNRCVHRWTLEINWTLSTVNTFCWSPSTGHLLLVTFCLTPSSDHLLLYNPPLDAFYLDDPLLNTLYWSLSTDRLLEHLVYWTQFTRTAGQWVRQWAPAMRGNWLCQLSWTEMLSS